MARARPELRRLVGAVAAALAGLLGGCTSDCEVLCGKLEACEQLLAHDVFACVDACDREADVQTESEISACADCLDAASCSELAQGTCVETCALAPGNSLESLR